MKLTKESVRPDLKLRQLVCHANLVDNLLGELSARRQKQTMVKLSEDAYDSVAVSSSDDDEDDDDDSPDLSDSSSDEDDAEYMKQPNYTYHPYQQEMLFEDASSEYNEFNPPPLYSVINTGIGAN